MMPNVIPPESLLFDISQYCFQSERAVITFLGYTGVQWFVYGAVNITTGGHLSVAAKNERNEMIGNE